MLVSVGRADFENMEDSKCNLESAWDISNTCEARRDREKTRTANVQMARRGPSTLFYTELGFCWLEDSVRIKTNIRSLQTCPSSQTTDV